jgi:hypothetical protein
VPRGDWTTRLIAGLERRRHWALATLLLGDLVVLLYMGRGLTFFFDEWDFVTHDYGGGLHSLLVAHVGNISILPIAVYKVLFHLVGLNHYVVFRCVVIALHLVAACLLYVLATRRLSPVPALLAVSIVLFLGAAWEDLLWAFQIGYLLSIVGGLAIWVLLERRDRFGDILALAALVVSLGSSSLGIPLAIGVATELAWAREWRRGWVVGVPALLYVAWYAGYGESQVTGETLIHAPGFAADLAAAACGAVIGRGLNWGRPLAVVGFLVLAWWLVGGRTVSARLVGLLASAVALWIITAATRSTISAPETSRYVYLGVVVIVLIGVELLHSVTTTPRALGVAALVVLFGALAGLTLMRDGAVSLRSTSKTLAAELGALELASAHAPPNYRPDPQRAPQVEAGPYLHTVRAIGSSPADSPHSILAADDGSRAAADSVLIALYAPTLMPVRRGGAASRTSGPELIALSGGVPGRNGGCLRLVPDSPAALSAELALSPRGVVVRDEGPAPVSAALRRFGPALHPLQQQVAGLGASSLAVPSDPSPVPWILQLGTTSPMSVCAAGG